MELITEENIEKYSNVVPLDVLTKERIPVENVIKGLEEFKEEIQDILVLMIDKDGHLIPFSNNADAFKLNYMVDQFKFNLVAGNYGQDEDD